METDKLIEKHLIEYDVKVTSEEGHTVFHDKVKSLSVEGAMEQVNLKLDPLDALYASWKIKEVKSK